MIMNNNNNNKIKWTLIIITIIIIIVSPGPDNKWVRDRRAGREGNWEW